MNKKTVGRLRPASEITAGRAPSVLGLLPWTAVPIVPSVFALALGLAILWLSPFLCSRHSCCGPRSFSSQSARARRPMRHPYGRSDPLATRRKHLASDPPRSKYGDSSTHGDRSYLYRRSYLLPLSHACPKQALMLMGDLDPANSSRTHNGLSQLRLSGREAICRQVIKPFISSAAALALITVNIACIAAGTVPKL